MMSGIVVSFVLALSLRPAYFLLIKVLCWRYGLTRITSCIVMAPGTFCRARLLLAVMALPVFLLVWLRGEAPHWLIFCYGLALLTLADMQMRLLPDYLLIILLWAGLLALALRLPGMPSPGPALLLFALVCVGAILFMKAQLAFSGRAGLAWGDLKLIAVLTVWLPYEQLPLALLVASLTGLVYILVKRWVVGADLRAIAFGPCLAFGALTVHLSAPGPTPV